MRVMQLTVRLIHETDTWLRQRLDMLHTQNELILTNQEEYMATIKELVASVAAVKGKADSIGALITQLKEQITGLTNGNLPPDVQAQVDQAFADAEAAKKDLSDAVDATPGVKQAGSAPEQDAPPPANTPFPPSPTPASAPFTPPGSSPTGDTQNPDGKHT